MAYLFDTFTNFLSGLGMAGRDKMTGIRFVKPIWTREQLEASFQSDWIARKAITIPAQDSVREWRSWQAPEEQIELIEATEKRLQIQLKMQDALTKARLYGGCCMMIGVEGNMEEELDPDTVGVDGLKFVHVFAPHQLAPQELIRDISDPYYGQPAFYTLNDATGQFGNANIHPSRMVRLIGLDTPDPMRNFGWGDPMMQVINDAVSACGTVTQSLATLIAEAKIDVIKIPGLTEIFSTSEGTNRVIKRFTEANVAKSVINAIVLDGEEEWQRIQVQFRGMPEIMQMYLQIAAGAADIPTTRFLGMSPGGLNATGDSDLQNYYNRISADQELRLRPALEFLDKSIIRSSLGSIDPSIFYEWNSLWEMSDTEKADIALKKSQATTQDVNSGLIPFVALSKGRCNQLIEDGTYPGLDAGIAEAEAAGEMPTEDPYRQPPSDPNNPNDPNNPPPDDNTPPTGDSFMDALQKFMDDWNEADHPRGQPENAGQFGAGGGSAKTKETKGRTRRAAPHAHAARARSRGAAREARAKPTAGDEGDHSSAGPTRAATAQHVSRGGAHPIKGATRLASGAVFVSPNVRSDLDLPGAVKELKSKQQAVLRLASADINDSVGLKDGHDTSMVGAWKDGAENSLMTGSDAPWENLELAGAMKAHLADQKSALIFKEQDGGKTVLASFSAKGSMEDIHKSLLEDGLANHTIVPTRGGAEVHVVDLDGSAMGAIKKGAQRYGEGNPIDLKFGRGEFIGTTKEDGTDREQRDSARSIYESIINRSSVPDAKAVWQRVNSTWGTPSSHIDAPKLEAKTKASVAAASAKATAEGHTPLPGSKGTHPDTIASRNPTAVKSIAAKGVYGQPDVESMKLEPDRFDHDVRLFANKDFYPNFRPDDFKGSADDAVKTVVDQMKGNLKFLYQFADKSTQVWYDGARSLVDEGAKKYGVADSSVAGVYAALSPTKDWDQNISLADRVMSTYKDHQNTPWDDKMEELAPKLWVKKNTKYVDQIKGKKLSELTTPAQKAAWIRTYDQAHSDQSYRVMLPDGKPGAIARANTGQSIPVVWQTLPSISNAVAALEANGDREKISTAMGTAHKVRSFYNNMLDPHSANDDVTVDTHAVGAALLRQLSNKSIPVAHDFGNTPEKKDQPPGWDAAGSSTKTGLSGTYAVYATAYREAAKELGIQPRQLQSAVWVVKRESFGNASKEVRGKVEQAWSDYHDNKATLNDTRDHIAKLVGLKK